MVYTIQAGDRQSQLAIYGLPFGYGTLKIDKLFINAFKTTSKKNSASSFLSQRGRQEKRTELINIVNVIGELFFFYSCRIYS